MIESEESRMSEDDIELVQTRCVEIERLCELLRTYVVSTELRKDRAIQHAARRLRRLAEQLQDGVSGAVQAAS